MTDRQLRALMAALLHSVGAKETRAAVDTTDAILKRVRDMPPEHEERQYHAGPLTLDDNDNVVNKEERAAEDSQLPKAEDILKEAQGRNAILRYKLDELRNSNEKLQKDVGELRAVNCNQAKDKAALEDEKAALEQKLKATKTDIRRYSRANSNLWDKLYEIRGIAEDIVRAGKIGLGASSLEKITRIINITKTKEDT